MRRSVCVMFLLCLSAMLWAKSSQKHSRLQQGTTVYVSRPVWWLVQPIEAHSLPLESIECTRTACRYTVAACTPLYVESQSKNYTSTLPADTEARRAIVLGEIVSGLSGRGSGRSVPGGWSSRSQRLWFISRDECFAKIGKQPEQQPSPSPYPAQQR
jgi:hypothetical protein